MKKFNDMDTELLSDIYLIIDKKCAEVESHLENGDLKNFTIVVHSLKTTCRMMGEKKLSEDFLELEMLGKSETYDALSKVRELTPNILDRFRKLKLELMPYINTDSEPALHFSASEIYSLLEEVELSAADFDILRAETATKKLLTYQCDKEFYEKLKQLSDLVNELDYDEARTLANKIKKSV
ncbi:hypothetical protein [Butyrivibrio sp. NC3005]|uniref:hypothetical protein n=1 Tax=Butyrivibrio sp. NC3005 TaxID=1280685 RepID=UPI0003FC775B|nr:hypothetical protein [Butyrivibrio sp. NC3005]